MSYHNGFCHEYENLKDKTWRLDIMAYSPSLHIAPLTSFTHSPRPVPYKTPSPNRAIASNACAHRYSFLHTDQQLKHTCTIINNPKLKYLQIWIIWNGNICLKYPCSLTSILFSNWNLVFLCTKGDDSAAAIFNLNFIYLAWITHS